MTTSAAFEQITVDPEKILGLRMWARAYLFFVAGEFADLAEAIEPLQQDAKQAGLTVHVGLVMTRGPA